MTDLSYSDLETLMTLKEKVLSLKLEAALAARHAMFWQKVIEAHGEHKATEFYKSLGLNHIERKSVTWEGLTLHREPTAVEKIAIKSLLAAQDAGKETITAILNKMRDVLIESALKKIKKLDAASYHELIISVPNKQKEDLREGLSKVFRKGRSLVAQELAKQKAARFDDAIDGDDDEELDDLTDLTVSRIANEIQARVTGAATRNTILGRTGDALDSAIETEMREGSTGYITRAAGDASNKVIALGRYAEMRDRSDEIERYEYSALADACEPCFEDDGLTADSPDELPTVPAIDCLGGPSCRCFVIAIVSGG